MSLLPAAPSPDPKHLPYLPHVDGLRALAVLLVVVFHAWPHLAPGGFVGVDVFFVISGFIITSQIAREMEAGTFSYAAFLGRRARRLIPAAFVCSVLVTVAALILLMPDAFEAFSRSLVACWAMIGNVYFFRSTGYFDAPAAEAPLLHMWSLAVEDQFYLTWPLLLLLLFKWRWTRPRILGAIVLLALLSLAHSEHAAHTRPEMAFYLPMSRAFELLAGCGLALALPYLRPVRGRALLDAAGLALVIASAFLLSAATPFPGFAALPAIAGSVLLIAPGLTAPTPVSRLLSLGPVVLIGRMSYSIYLYHWPILAFATYTLGRAPQPAEAAALMALAMGLAALSWLFVEQKLTRAIGLYTASPLSLMGRTLAASGAFVVFGLAGLAGEGWPQRLDEPTALVYRAATSSNPLRHSCDGYDLAFSHQDACTFGAPLGKTGYEIAVFGDSNADHFVPMIAKLAARAKLPGRQVTQSMCGPLIGAKRMRAENVERACTAYQRTILDFLDRNPNLKIAVLSSAWSSYTKASANKLFPEAASGEPRPFADFARHTIDTLRRRGIKVLVIGQVPHFRTFSLSCLVNAARLDTEAMDCTIPRAQVDRELDPSQTAFRAIAASDPGVTFLDMVDLLCTRDRCSAFKDDILLYRDRGHLNGLGAAYLARYATLPSVAP
ncbi:acyltransferase family protein [Hyphomicrobium sp.]|uniref:acyltransferase family protein n=1 Tax=Hyphomicrobium sp. TaxID=82 RepID=UPI002FE30EB8